MANTASRFVRSTDDHLCPGDFDCTDSRHNPPAGIDHKLRGNECLNCYWHPRMKGSEICRSCASLSGDTPDLDGIDTER